MIVFEHSAIKSIKLNQAREQAVAIMTSQEKQDEENRSRFFSQGLDQILWREPYECHLLYDTVVIGVFTPYEGTNGSNKGKIK